MITIAQVVLLLASLHLLALYAFSRHFCMHACMHVLVSDEKKYKYYLYNYNIVIAFDLMVFVAHY